MRMAEALVAELTVEAATTKRVLDRVPEAHLGWQPHRKSMSLGQLALHVATVPSCSRRSRRAWNRHGRTWRTSATNERRPPGGWSLVSENSSLHRIAILRSFMFNHWYHHRGQLVVYLRLLDVPVPSVYGPTADESPFAAV